MPTPQRLPIVNNDDGVWGDILRQYLKKEHYDDGTDNAVNGGHQNITIRAGTASAAPITFTSGTNLSSATAGAMEYDGTSYYLTPSSATRKKVAIYNDASGATGDIYYRDSSGNFTRLAAATNGNMLTLASGLPSWTSSITGMTLSNTNTITVKDSTSLTVQNATDTTKQLRFDLSGLTTGHTTTLAVPEVNGTTTIVGTDTTQTLTNKTIIGSSGMLVPVQCHTDGSETYTISGGSVTQIAGTTIQGTSPYSPAVGDRILILTAPASTGAGVQFSITTQPANGIYVVTSNTTNLSLSRTADMSGSVNPAGLSVYSENSTVGWLPQTIWTVTTPSSAGAFTWGTGNIKWGSTGGRTMTPNYIYLSTGTNAVGMWNGTGSTYISSSTNAGNQSFTLPATATSDTLVGRASTDTLTNKRITPRVVSVSSSATPAINTDNGDHFNLTALAVAVTSMTTNLTGTPTDGQRFMLRIKDNGTARAITWGASFLSSGSARLLTTTSVNMTHHLGFIWDAAKSAWICIAVDAVGY